MTSTRIRWHRPLLVLSFAMALLAVIAAVGLAIDHRTVAGSNGSPIWLKPLKFAISLSLLGATLAWMLSLSPRGRRVGWWAGTAVAVASFSEIGLVLMQALRGRASHFNHSTAFDANVFSAMGMLVVVLWTATFVLGVVVTLQRHLEPALKWAIRFGLAVSLAGMAIGFLMTMPTTAQQRALAADQPVPMIGAHSVGVADGGPGLPLTGWSTTGGDLRIPHFIGLHALQIIPLVAVLLLVASRRWPVLAGGAVRVRLVVVAAAGYTGLVGLLLWQALRGQPLIHPDLRTLAAFAVLISVVLASAALSLASTRSPAAVPTAPVLAGNRR
jgi:hypothetical protein